MLQPKSKDSGIMVSDFTDIIRTCVSLFARRGIIMKLIEQTLVLRSKHSYCWIWGEHNYTLLELKVCTFIMSCSGFLLRVIGHIGRKFKAREDLRVCLV